MNDGLGRGLSAVNEFLQNFMSGHAGRMAVHTYGPDGGEPRIVSYDIGVHEIDGADAAEWVIEGATIVISIQRRRPAVDGPPTTEASRRDPIGVTAQFLRHALETEPTTYPGAPPPKRQASASTQLAAEERERTEPATDARTPKRSTGRSAHRERVKGDVPRMPLAPGVEP